jgi:dihydroflavonol-4-reductase
MAMHFCIQKWLPLVHQKQNPVILKVLITGADGLLGANIVRRALSQGYQVRVLQLPSSQSPVLKGLPIELSKGNLLNAPEVDRAVAGCDYVIHTGASTSVWPSRSAATVAVNVRGTQHIIASCLKHSVQRLVYISSAASFSKGTLERPGDETGVFDGHRYGLDYIDSKYQAHQMVKKAVREQGLPAVLVCPTFMFGPYDSKPSSGAMLLAVVQGTLPFYTRGGKNFVDARDVAAATCNALKMGRVGESYIAGHKNLAYADLFKLIGQTLDAKPPRFRIPSPLVLSYGRLHSFLAPRLRYSPMISLPIARISCDGQYFSPAKAVAELQMPQTPLAVTIRDAYDWLERHQSGLSNATEASPIIQQTPNV